MKSTFGYKPRQHTKKTLVDIIEIKTGIQKQLIFDAGTPQYLESGHIVFCRKSDLYAVKFNPVTLELGEELQVLNLSGLKINLLVNSQSQGMQEQ